MTIAIDTNILFDILLPDPKFKDSSLELIKKFSKSDRLVISEIVYSELASQFNKKPLLESFLSDVNIFIKTTSKEGLWIAAKVWAHYNNKRNKKLQCTNCGNLQTYYCEQCNEIIKSKQHIIPDFIIGGHATENGNVLITRDRGFYKKYFKNLKIIS